MTTAVTTAVTTVMAPEVATAIANAAAAAVTMAVNLKSFAPELVLVAGLCFLFLLDAIIPSSRGSRLPLWVVVFSCILGALVSVGSPPAESTRFFSGLIVSDGLTTFFRVFFFFATALSAILAFSSTEIKPGARTEFCLLLLCVAFGLCLMACSMNLLLLYIGIETVSIVSFVMAGLNREDARSNEASLKYLVFGAVASAIMIYGFSLLYGITGSLEYSEIGRFLQNNPDRSGWVLVMAVTMVYAGLAYKISSFPLHFWTPDVYEGSPTPVATFFSIAPKAAGFAALIRFLLGVLSVPGAPGSWSPLPLGAGSWPQAIAVISVVTMVVGNLSALGQRNVKRILAYSSIAHVGYLLMGLISANGFGVNAVLFYLISYCLMNLGAFWIVALVAERKGAEDLDAFRGLGWEDPVSGVCMAVFLFSLTGIPLFSGFVGKFLLFANVIQTPGFLWLAVIGVLNSVISLFYYASILRVMWLDKPDSIQVTELPLLHRVTLVGLAVPTVVLGLYFEPVLRLTQSLVASLR